MTNNKDIKNDIITILAIDLAAFGFKPKRSSFIREPEPGLYQIIEINLGSSTTIKANHIGLSFGITTEEWLSKLIDWGKPKILTSADCEVRDCYCNLIQISDETTWFNISIELASLAKKISSHIKNIIIPYLDKFKTRSNIISMWRQHGHAIGFAEGRHLLAIGTLMYLTNEKDDGEHILKKLLNDKKDNSYFTFTINKTLDISNNSD